MQLKVILLTLILPVIRRIIQVLWKAMAVLFYFPAAAAEVEARMSATDLVLQEEEEAVVAPQH